MNNKKGFISISLVYTILVLFLTLLSSIILFYASNRIMLNKSKQNIKEELKKVIDNNVFYSNELMAQSSDDTKTFCLNVDRSRFETINILDHIDDGIYDRSITTFCNATAINGNTEEMDDESAVVWSIDSDRDGLYELYIGQEEKVIVSNADYLFYGFSNVTKIVGLENLDTSNNRSMQYMFAGLTSYVNDLFLNNLHTENVKDMSHMFEGSKFRYINIQQLDMSQVTNMSSIFKSCSELAAIDFHIGEKIITSVTNMSSMFEGCSTLTAVDFSAFDTQNVTDMSSMFKSCSSFVTLSFKDSLALNTSNVENMESMFENCSSLVYLSLRKFDTSKVTNMSYMFAGCIELGHTTSSWHGYSSSSSSSTTINGQLKLWEDFVANSVVNMKGMFQNCSSLKSLNFSNFNTSYVIDMSYLFSGCSVLKSITFGENFDTTAVTDMNHMFCNCVKLTSLYLTSFKTSSVTNMNSMFSGCEALADIYVTNSTTYFNVNNVTNSTDMFSGCNVLHNFKKEFPTDKTHAIIHKTRGYLETPPSE